MLETNSDQFSIYQKVHIIGIGGIGISGLARILKQEGHQISGSDLNQNNITEDLKTEGMTIYYGHAAENIPADCQLVVHTTAIPKTNPELIEATKRGLPILTYPQAVGKLTRNYQTISVCGTHGKTTTTSMIGLALVENQADPTIIVGSLLRELDNKNERIGKSRLFVLESCEYQEAFLNYHPSIIVLNNVEEEHLDYFGTKERYLQAFEKFIKQLQPGGILIANGDEENVREVIARSKPEKVITFGQKTDNDYIIKNHQVFHQNELVFSFNLGIPGTHNIYNATAAMIVSEYLKLNRQTSLQTINNFRGAARRFEIKGQIDQTTIIDDYGHTPAEIQSTLQGLRERFGQNAKILCIFQPHQYSRTYQFLDQFADSFHQVNQVYIPNIYRTRDSDEDVQKVSPEILVQHINLKQPQSAQHTKNLEDTYLLISQNYSQYDVIITMGAGDITKLSSRLIESLKLA
jgi:UDP-N-acetylmuramate--alanine ligase